MLLKNIEKTNDNINVYHSADCISASGLKTIYNESIGHYLDPQKFKPTRATELGNAVHTCLYEGLSVYKKEYFVMPKLDLRKTPDKELKIELDKKSGDKMQIDQNFDNVVMRIYENAKSDSQIEPYLNGDIEISHYGELNNIPVRVRPDCIGNNWISDIKTCQSSNPKKFKWTIQDWAYHLQAVFYCEMLGYDPKNFRFIACQTNTPYKCELIGLSDENIERGKYAWRSAWFYWTKYLETGIITGYEGYERTEDGAVII